MTITTTNEMKTRAIRLVIIWSHLGHVQNDSHLSRHLSSHLSSHSPCQ